MPDQARSRVRDLLAGPNVNIIHSVRPSCTGSEDNIAAADLRRTAPDLTTIAEAASAIESERKRYSPNLMQGVGR